MIFILCLPNRSREDSLPTERMWEPMEKNVEWHGCGCQSPRCLCLSVPVFVTLASHGSIPSYRMHSVSWPVPSSDLGSLRMFSNVWRASPCQTIGSLTPSPREPLGTGVFPSKVGVEKSLDVICGPAAKEQKQRDTWHALITLLECCWQTRPQLGLGLLRKRVSGTGPGCLNQTLHL